MRAHLVVSDPWEFLDDNGFSEMEGTVASIERTKLIVDLDQAFSIGSVAFDRVYVHPRHEGGSFEDLRESEALPVNIGVDGHTSLIGTISLFEDGT